MMIRQIIIPTQNTYLLHLPDDLIGKHVELIAFAEEDIANPSAYPSGNGKRTLTQALEFY